MAEPVLIVAAHPDDEVLGAGGTIARLAAEGRPVHIAILGEGVSGRYADPGDAPAADLAALRDQSRRVADLLGAASHRVLDVPDNRADTVPLLEIVRKVEALVRDLRPTEVYCHHPGDLNVDHRRSFEAVLAATRPVGSTTVRDVYAFEVPSSTEWAFQRLEPAFRPSVFVGIGAFLESKLAAMALYDGESRPFPHPRSAEALRAVARRWGSVAGLDAAEAFELVRSVRP